MSRSWHFLYLFAGLLVQRCSADGGDDFSNNLFSDLAPILALFGERVTMQFLSQSAGWADCIIFAMAPLGIMTAIVSAIRVGGPSWLKALIGRSRENTSAAEMELMSSTSKEACELWNGQDVVRCQGSASIYEFIILLPQGIRDEATRKLQKVRIMRLQDAQSTLVKRINPEEPNVWAQLSRWLGLGVWSREEDNHEAVKVDKKQEDPERGQRQRGTIGTTFSQSDHEEQTTRTSVEKEPIIGNSQAKGKLEAPEEEIVIMRNTKADAPNITFNRPKNVGRREVYLVATFGIVLQLGVLLFFGLITYYPTLSYQKDGKTVVAYACPLAVIGTVVLVLGMLLCSHVVDSTTQEDRYEAARGKTAQMVWLQQETTVSDQLFSSVALFPPQTSKVVTTSSRVLTDNPTERGALQKTVIETKAIIGTTVGLLGFIIQFIGLRGMHWSASIAQLIAVAIMTALRAWVRRGFTDELCSKRLSQSYELDWLALNLGDPDHVFWSKLNPDPTSKTERTWKVAAGGIESQYEALEPRYTKPQPEAQGEQTESSTISNRFNAQGIMMMRRNLAKLTNWHSPVREQAICLTRAIEVVMNSLFAPERLEADDQQIQRFIWRLHVDGGPEGRECIQLHVDRDNDKRTWKAYADEVEAVLSLWLYSTRNSAQKPGDFKSQRAETISACSNIEDDTWLRARGLRSQRLWRLVGPYTKDLHRDLGWWIPSGPFNLFKLTQPEPERQEHSMNLEDEKQEVTHCGALYEKNNETTATLWLMDRHRGEDDCLLSGSLFRSYQKNDTKMGLLAVESHDTMDKAHVLNLLSAFVWAAAKTLKAPIGDDSEFQPSNAISPDVQIWKFFTLKSESLSKLAQSIHDTGLGSLRDIYVSIVMPLSINHKLPELGAVVEIVCQRANQFRQSKDWYQACSEYIWLSELGSKFPPSSLVYLKATALLLMFQETLVDYRTSKGVPCDGESSECESIDEEVQTVMRRLKAIDSDVLTNLRELQRLQGRPWDSTSRDGLGEGIQAWLAGPGNAQNMRLTKTHRWAINEHVFRDPPNEDGQGTEKPDVMGWRPLHYTAAMGRDHRTNLLLEHKADPNAQDIWGCTPMHYLRSYRSWVILECLRDHGGDLNAVSIESRTPLHYSALRGDLKLTKSLIAAKADTRIRDIDGRTPIHLAAIHGRADIMPLLEGDFDLADSKGHTALYLAALNGQVKVVEELVQTHGNVVNLPDGRQDHMRIHLRDSKGETPIFSAVKGGVIDIVEFLIKQGANVNDVKDDGSSPLYAAVKNKDLEMTKTLLKAGAIIEIEDCPNRTPLSQAASDGTVGILKTLLEASADPIKKTSFYEPLGLAIDNRDHIIVDMLLKAGADPNEGTFLQEAPLLQAVLKTDLISARLLIEAGADINAVADTSGGTMLHRAVEHGRVDMVKFLLEAGAVVNVANLVGETPLHRALRWDTGMDKANLLLKAGADPNARYWNGKAFWIVPLQFAAILGRTDMVKLLLEAGAGASVNISDHDGYTPLHTAVLKQDMVMAKLLLKAGACVNAQNNLGEPPLTEAVARRKSQFVELLIEWGADVNLVNTHGQTLLDLALNAQHGSLAVAGILKKAGGVRGPVLTVASGPSE